MGEFNFTGRLTGTPWRSEKGKKVVHVGLGYSYRRPSEPGFRFHQRPEAHLAPRFVDTGTLRMQSAHLLGPEFALVYGPASVQTEYVRAGLNPIQGNPNSNFHGYYLLGSYFSPASSETTVHRKVSSEDQAQEELQHPPKGNGRPGKWRFAIRRSI